MSVLCDRCVIYITGLLIIQTGVLSEDIQGGLSMSVHLDFFPKENDLEGWMQIRISHLPH